MVKTTRVLLLWKMLPQMCSITDGNIFINYLRAQFKNVAKSGQMFCNHSRYEDPWPEEFLYLVAEQGTLEVNRVVRKQIQMCTPAFGAWQWVSL